MSIFKNGLLFGEKSSDGLIKDQDGNFRVAVIEPRIFNLHDNTQGAASPQVARKYRWSPDSQALFCVKDSSPWSIHKTNQTFRQLEENTSAPLAATTEAIAVNSTHFFAQDWSTYTIRKYLMSNLSYIGQTSSVSNMFTALVADDSFLFIARGTDTIRKYNAGTLAYIGATASISNGGALAIDNTYLYAKRDSVYINKYLKSNLSYVGTSAAFAGGAITSLHFENEFLYALVYDASVPGNRKIHRVDPSDLSIVKSSSPLIVSAAVEIYTTPQSRYFVVSGGSHNIVNVVDKETLELKLTPTTGANSYIAMAGNGYVYAANAATMARFVIEDRIVFYL